MGSSLVDTNRFGQLITLAGLLALALGLGAQLSTGIRSDAKALEDTRADGERPNILMIVADDLGYDDNTLYNPASPARTPALQELAREGVLFSRHYADATCTPSRVSILTGMYAQRMGFRQTGLEIPPEILTLPEALHNAGYQTHLVGKWHAGEARPESLPLSQGFDSFFGFHNQWELAGEVTPATRGRQKPTYNNPWLREGRAPLVQHSGHLTDILVEKSLQTIRSHAASDEPWFLYHGFLAPHTPIQPAERFRANRPGDAEGQYLALVDQMDDAVGQLMTALRETGQDENTLVIFVSDNGGTNRERDNNYPWYGKKDETYEGSFRTPLLMRLPQAQAAGKAISQTVMNVDIFPTVLDLAGVERPGETDGQSLRGAIIAGHTLEPAARSWEKYIWNIDAMTYSFLSASGRWRLSNVYGLPPELYDLDSNPQGDQALSADHAPELSTLVNSFQQTSWSNSLLPTAATSDSIAAATEYSGFDMTRTPFRHSFAIGLEIPSQQGETSLPHDYARQEGAWRLSHNSAGQLQLDLGNFRLNTAALDPGRCNDIVITGHFQPSAMYVETDTGQLLKLYINGQLQGLLNEPAFVPPELTAMSNPTLVFNRGRAVFSNLLLGSASDPYQPRVPLEHRDLFYEMHEQGRLQRADIQSMRDLLCNNTP